MAQIEFTALVNDIRGRCGDIIYSFSRGVHYIKRHQPAPAYPASPRQLAAQAHFKFLMESWQTLPEASRDIWLAWASARNSRWSGLSAFLRLNQALLMADHPDLVPVYLPPSQPGPAVMPFSFSAAAAGPSVVQLFWGSPRDQHNYISAWYRLPKSFCRQFPDYGRCPSGGYRPSRRFISTVRSDAPFIGHAHDFPSGARIIYQLRSIDICGQRSPWSNPVSVILP